MRVRGGGLQVTNGQSFTCSHIFQTNIFPGGLIDGLDEGEGGRLQVTNGQSAAAAH